MRVLLTVLLLSALVLGGLVLGFGQGMFSSDRATSAAADVSPEAARSAERKLERLRREGEEVRLTEAEVASLVRYGSETWVPGLGGQVEVTLSGTALTLSGAVPAERIPDVPELESLRFLLPDTVPVMVGGDVRSLRDGAVVLDITTIEVFRMPIPARIHPVLLDRLGRRDRPGLAPTALELPLPSGVSSARVEGGELVLTP
jgi:hypothetical protein